SWTISILATWACGDAGGDRSAPLSSGDALIRQAPPRMGDIGRSVLAPDFELPSWTSLPSGLARTLDWYRQQRGAHPYPPLQTVWSSKPDLRRSVDRTGE